jgi:predicted  nucleic acid-binding Zn-ribbon protein
MMTLFKNLRRVAELAELDKTISDLRETISGYQTAYRDVVAKNATLNRRNAELIARNVILTRELAAARDALLPNAKKCA